MARAESAAKGTDTGGLGASLSLTMASAQLLTLCNYAHGLSPQLLQQATVLLADPTCCIDARGPNGDTPLQLASKNGDVNLAKLLLDHGADPNASDPHEGGEGAIFHAVAHANLTMMSHLIKAKADVNATHKRGNSPLIEACLMNNLSVVSLLLESGADVHQENEQGDTPLAIALRHGSDSFLASAIRHHPRFVADGPGTLDCGAAPSAPPDASEPHHAGTLTPNYLNQRVLLHGLHSRQELNGRMGVAFTFNEDSGRYGVKVDGSTEKVLLRPANLRLIAEAESAEGKLSNGVHPPSCGGEALPSTASGANNGLNAAAAAPPPLTPRGDGGTAPHKERRAASGSASHSPAVVGAAGGTGRHSPRPTLPPVPSEAKAIASPPTAAEAPAMAEVHAAAAAAGEEAAEAEGGGRTLHQLCTELRARLDEAARGAPPRAEELAALAARAAAAAREARRVAQLERELAAQLCRAERLEAAARESEAEHTRRLERLERELERELELELEEALQEHSQKEAAALAELEAVRLQLEKGRGAEERLAEARAQVEALQAQLEQQKQQGAALASAVEAGRAEAERRGGESALLKQQLEAREQAGRELRRQLEEASLRHSNALHDLAGERHNWRHYQRRTERALVEMNNELQVAHDQKSLLLKELRAAETAMHQSREEALRAAEALKKLEDELAESFRNQAGLEMQADEMAEELSEQKARAEQALARVQLLEKAVSETSAQLVSLRGELDAADSRWKEAQLLLTEEQRRVQLSSAAGAAAQQELQGAVARLEEERRRAAEAEERCGRQRAWLEQTLRQVEAKAAELEAKAAELEAADARGAELEAKLAEEQAARNRMRREMEAAAKAEVGALQEKASAAFEAGKAAAEKEAQRLCEEARHDGRAEGLHEGVKEGYAQGRREGLKESKAEAAAKLKKLEASLEKLEAARAAEAREHEAAMQAICEQADARLNAAVREAKAAEMQREAELQARLQEAKAELTQSSHQLAQSHERQHELAREAAAMQAQVERLQAQLEEARDAAARAQAAAELAELAAREAGGPPAAEHAARGPVVLRQQDIKSATASFSADNIVGSGGFGTVFKATPLAALPHAGGVAVKRRDAARSQGGELELLREVQLLGTCHHAHLLPLLGFCLEPKCPCLVYPLMLGGNLEDRLLLTPEGISRLRKLGFESAPPVLSWMTRLRVMKTVTEALVYLHTPGPGKTVELHHDIKPSNILLDAQLNAYLGDVGLAVQADGMEADRTHVSLLSVLGTTGFIDPLLSDTQRASTVTDGYALGICLLMCLTSLPALDIKAKCRKLLVRPGDLTRWEAPGVPDDRAGPWPPAVAATVAGVVSGLVMPQFKEDRMSVPRALERLEVALAMASPEEVAAEPSHIAWGANPSSVDTANKPSRAPQPRECIMCMDRPRSVRFGCGHAVCCEECSRSLLSARQPCPSCREEIVIIDSDPERIAWQQTYVQQRRPMPSGSWTPSTHAGDDSLLEPLEPAEQYPARNGDPAARRHAGLPHSASRVPPRGFSRSPPAFHDVADGVGCSSSSLDSAPQDFGTGFFADTMDVAEMGSDYSAGALGPTEAYSNHDRSHFAEASDAPTSGARRRTRPRNRGGMSNGWGNNSGGTRRAVRGGQVDDGPLPVSTSRR